MTAYHIIIPARYDSRRLPGKPLADIGGKPMIRRVAEGAMASAAQSVTIATDDARIRAALEGCGARVVMTSPDHPSGSDRVAAAAAELELAPTALIINLQGDEPFMPAALPDQVAALLAAHPPAAMATLATPLQDPTEHADPAVVKVITDRHGYAMYFSRAAIPWRAPGAAIPPARRHIGLYAYRHAYLQEFTRRPPCPPEQWERLEQLRALWHGDKIACADATTAPAAGVDTAADLQRARAAVAARP